VKLKQVGIVGSGAMGRGIAQLLAQSGFPVKLFDSQPAALVAAMTGLTQTFDTLVAKSKIDTLARNTALSRLATVEQLEQLSDCDLVIEAIVENLDLKRGLFAQLEKIVQSDCILVSNTSSLSITAIAAQCEHPERVAGLHFFNPVPLMKVVEVVRAARTAQSIIERLARNIGLTGHMAVVCSDTPGFVINHAGRGYGTEALKIIGEGVVGPASTDSKSYATVDDIMREQVRFNGLGFRLGPFELLDLTALDVSHPVMEAIYRQYFDEPRFRPSVITAQRLAAGLLGKKTNAGFYSYVPGSEKPATDASTQLTSQTQLPRVVWVGPGIKRNSVIELLEQLNAKIEHTASPSIDALILLLPEGKDCTASAIELGVAPNRCIALDTWFDLGRSAANPSLVRRVLMTNPATETLIAQSAVKLFSADKAKVSLIQDSPGFIAPRIVAMIVSIACEMAQAGIASAADIDKAVQLGLGYPVGPLTMGDHIGPARVLGLIDDLYETTKDPRYRPSLWLRRRAMLGMSLL
jgi:3-hydroxybutyryl-CoA dehydrogenase